MISEDTRKVLLASKVKGVGRRSLLDITANRLFWELSVSDWHLRIPQLRNFVPGSAEFSKALSATETDIELAEKQGASILGGSDASYPTLLRTLRDRPPILYVRGNPAVFTSKAVAIIGTREPSDHGQALAREIATYFATRGWQVVSGLAIGVDTIAHETTLEAGGSTVAVLANGLDAVYPKKNEDLANRILESGGLLISEYSYGTSSFPAYFIERDRVQAALTQGVVMVQSTESGGSLHASRAALRYGCWLMVPAPTDADATDPGSVGRANYLIADGTEKEKTEILKCKADDLQRILVLRSTDDYREAESRLHSGMR